MDDQEKPHAISIKFDPGTRDKMRLVSSTIGFSENHLVNLCVEAIFDMVWKGDAAGLPQIVKLLRVAMEDEIRKERAGGVEEARLRVFEVAEEEASPKLRRLIREFDKAVQAGGISYSRRKSRRKSKSEKFKE